MDRTITEHVQAQRGELRWVSFGLPDGQQVDVMVRMNRPGECQKPRWEVTAWHIKDDMLDPHGQKMACFELPVDTTVYVA